MMTIIYVQVPYFHIYVFFYGILVYNTIVQCSKRKYIEQFEKKLTIAKNLIIFKMK